MSLFRGLHLEDRSVIDSRSVGRHCETDLRSLRSFCYCSWLGEVSSEASEKGRPDDWMTRIGMARDDAAYDHDFQMTMLEC